MMYPRINLTLLLVAAAQAVYSNKVVAHGLLRGAPFAVDMQENRALMSLQEECMLKGCEVTNDADPSLAHPGEASGIGGGTKDVAQVEGEEPTTGSNGHA